MTFLTPAPESGKPQQFSWGWPFWLLSHLHLPGAAKQGLEDSLLHATPNGFSSPPSHSQHWQTGRQPQGQGLSRHLPATFSLQTGQANKPLANMKPVFYGILLNNPPGDNRLREPSSGNGWQGVALPSADLVNSCRIQFTHSFGFYFQLKLDWNQVICQQTINHCLATSVGMCFHQQPCCSRAFLHDAPLSSSPPSLAGINVGALAQTWHHGARAVSFTSSWQALHVILGKAVLLKFLSWTRITSTHPTEEP